MNGSGRPHTSRPQERERREERGVDDRRRRPRQGVAAEGSMVGDERDRSSSLELTTEWDLDERGGGSESSPGRLPREGARGNGHARPTPSYALPTKHFKTLDRYCDCYIHTWYGTGVLHRTKWQTCTVLTGYNSLVPVQGSSCHFFCINHVGGSCGCCTLSCSANRNLTLLER